jgi:hypothetical protein
MNRISASGLVVLFAIIPLYGTFGGFAPASPGIPPLVPRSVAAAIGLVGLAAVLAVVPAARGALRRDWLTVAFLAPGAATILAAIPGFDPLLGIGLGVMVTGLGAAGLTLARVADAATTRLCIRSFLWSALGASVLALAMVGSQRPVALYAFNAGRAIGTFLNPNELAAYAIVALGVAVPLALVSRGRDRLATVSAAILVVTLAATFSRWGAFSAVCGVAVYGLAARARALLVAAVVAAVAGIALDAAAGAAHHNPRDARARAVAWQTGLSTFERFPLLGVGPFAFPHTYDALRPPDAPGTRTAVAFDPHSLPIAFAAEGGSVALVTLFASFTIVVVTVLRSARGAAGTARTLGFGLAAALLALFIDVGINTLNLFFPLGLQVVPLALAVIRTNALR